MLIHDVAEYIQQEIHYPPFLVQHLLPRGGSMLLYGKPGVKKSWLAQHMAFCVATGTEWMGFETSQARVLLVNFEISPMAYHHRLVLMSQSFTVEGERLYEASPSMLPLDEDAVFRNFQADVDSVSPDMVILDCMSGCFAGDENSGADLSSWLMKMSELKGEGRGLVIIHHSNKNLLFMSPMDKARGHTKLTGWVDSVVQLVSQQGTSQLQFGKVRLAPFVLPSMNITFENYVWSRR